MWADAVYGLKAEFKDADAAGQEQMYRQFLSYSESDPLDPTKGAAAFMGWLQRFDGVSSGIERLHTTRSWPAWRSGGWVVGARSGTSPLPC